MEQDSTNYIFMMDENSHKRDIPAARAKAIK